MKEWMRNISIPGDAEGEPGTITICDLAEGVRLLIVDIRSQRIPDIFSPEEKTEALLNINYCFQGRCELALPNGDLTFLESHEIALDATRQSHDNSIFYYPWAEYAGINLLIQIERERANGLSIGDIPILIPDKLYKVLRRKGRPYIGTVAERSRGLMQMLREDTRRPACREVLLLDVCRLLFLLQEFPLMEDSSRTYYTASQMKIAQLTMDAISSDLRHRLSARELAARFKVSETSLKTYFRGVFGKGYREYQHELRMKEAARLLRNKELKIGEISNAVGFASQSRFARAFRSYYEVTPMEYRRRKQLEQQGIKDKQ